MKQEYRVKKVMFRENETLIVAFEDFSTAFKKWKKYGDVFQREKLYNRQ